MGGGGCVVVYHIRQKERTMASVRDKNMENPVYRFCYTVAESILANEAGVETRAVFKRLSRSRAYQRSGRIEFGYKSIQTSWVEGCPEYRRAAATAGVSELSGPGWEAVWREVIHEAAHVVQFVADGRSDAHGESFARVLQWLRLTYPIDRCLRIAGVTLADRPEGWGEPGVQAQRPREYGDITFRVGYREKKQWYSWRMQKDGATVNISWGKPAWRRMSSDEQLFLDRYVKADCLMQLGKAAYLSYEDRRRYRAIGRRLGYFR